ncbi:MAG: energy-dependent translational throttle protein EttA [Rickettsiales bacterium]|nr:energy-dependent translational throttle protein EttA [Rickettsiales bacterium]
MAEFVYTLQGLRKVTPRGKEILQETWLSFLPGAKIGVLGHNGSGKSTLLRILAGVDTDYLGEAVPMKGLKIGYLPQEPELDPNKNVRENIEDGVAETRALLAAFEACSMRFAEPLSDDEMNKLLAEQGELQDKIEAADAWELDRHVETAMDALRVPDGDADVSKLSGGERRRVALCRLVLERPEMLLLDEPTNHLDAESVAWLETFLEQYPGTVVAVTHDRYFLDNVAGWILELDRGKAYPYEGNYSGWLVQKERRLAQEKREDDNRRKVLTRELEWVNSSQKARQSKGKARLNRYEELLAQDGRGTIERGTIFIPPGPRLGEIVLEAKELQKGYEDRLLIDGLDFVMPRGAIVGVIGANGAGKTTLFRMITGAEQPDAGALRLGETVEVAYVDQSRDALDPDKTVWEEISGGYEQVQLGKREINSRAYVSWFNFKGTAQQQKLGQMSGGERNRVHMAKLLKSGGNLLLLDEPSNDLDVETLRALEDALLNFAGSAIVISHDRWFLDRIATHILAFEGDSAVQWFPGNYSEYEADRKARLGDAAERPRRIKFRRLAG